ncbi:MULTISPECIES: XyeA family cyclophane-containing RiPP triceptide [Providencia]|uniref:XyeA family cyclophane-containing RiPP triceptide n=1 Tax=Providencia TaxID=586 RepID=UPI00197E94CF|nr:MULTISPECIES: XyeA family cyclophane-containing RiPP triceptide [Providencia]HEC8330558.1 XyeA family putative rSAM-modified RiPP [Providencia rettgeri]MBN4864162.1 putative rSAM-modified RiPP, XyeA family [Providencia stuartii]MBN4873484.1 putative rSAM-modified RiPP, XyeA family [Providencia stuartii]MBN4877395.1 putative rSAM-modified RiPP, XyeA family [Providencia stuartii]MBN4882685.1 putative rSAM-modified RiPP, XyeA family [Providencia stuartii]
MSKLSKEIKENNASVKLAPNERSSREVLIKSMLESVSGGWVNVFARWDKQI